MRTKLSAASFRKKKNGILSIRKFRHDDFVEKKNEVIGAFLQGGNTNTLSVRSFPNEVAEALFPFFGLIVVYGAEEKTESPLGGSLSLLFG